ncbi:MAG: PilZ domain-containing protein [Candidatus Omnitrophica bacterium]|nr:PilZ domain-containing protein [Candidatus Omnitrophota bacterium]
MSYKCLIYIGKKESGKAISTHTENIGAGGICVILDEDLGLFQGVDLEVDLENGVPINIKCSGTVVWVVKKRDIKGKAALHYDTGIEFVDLNEESKNRITKIVEKHLK